VVVIVKCHATVRDLRRRRRVDRVHVGGARIEAAVATAPDTAGGNGEGTAQEATGLLLHTVRSTPAFAVGAGVMVKVTCR
jgi:hypothetical protein